MEKQTNGRIALTWAQWVWAASIVFMLGAQWFRLGALETALADVAMQLKEGTYSKREIDAMKTESDKSYAALIAKTEALETRLRVLETRPR